MIKHFQNLTAILKTNKRPKHHCKLFKRPQKYTHNHHTSVTKPLISVANFTF
ncbi:hypothetical protein X975_17322, partial [Stegodyphus mimosarum]